MCYKILQRVRTERTTEVWRVDTGLAVLAQISHLCGHSHLLALKRSRGWGKSRVFPKMGHKTTKTPPVGAAFSGYLVMEMPGLLSFQYFRNEGTSYYKTQQANVLLALPVLQAVYSFPKRHQPNFVLQYQVYSSKEWWFSSTTPSRIVEQILTLRDVSQLPTFLQVCLLDISSYQGNPYLVNIYIRQFFKFPQVLICAIAPAKWLPLKCDTLSSSLLTILLCSDNVI